MIRAYVAPASSSSSLPCMTSIDTSEPGPSSAKLAGPQGSAPSKIGSRAFTTGDWLPGGAAAGAADEQPATSDEVSTAHDTKRQTATRSPAVALQARESVGSCLIDRLGRRIG